MRDADPRPLEHALGQPVLTRGRARVIRASRYLRHVHHRLQTGLFSGGDEHRRRFQKAFGHRVCEVRTLHPIQRGTHVCEAVQIADRDVGAELAELSGPFIGPAHQRPNWQPPCQQLARDMVARGSMTSAGADSSGKVWNWLGSSLFPPQRERFDLYRGGAVPKLIGSSAVTDRHMCAAARRVVTVWAAARCRRLLDR